MSYSSDKATLKVLVVDDSAWVRAMLVGILSRDPQIEVIGTAEHPYEAREKIKSLNPDVITLDIEMPQMNGIDFLEKIMRLRPMPVIMISTLTRRGAEITLKALEMGAFDTIAKPTTQDEALLETLSSEIIAKVKAAGKSLALKARSFTTTADAIQHTPSPKNSRQIIAMGASTGGVEAVRYILPRLPATLPPILYTQHMADAFIAPYAERLAAITAIRVRLAAHGDALKCGYLYVAPTGKHLTVEAYGTGYRAHLLEGERVSGHLPSIDVMLDSVATVAGMHAIGLLLTGMGHDGAKGMLKLHESGAYTIAQDEESSVVYGMPKQAKLLGAVVQECSLTDIPQALVKQC